MGDYFSEYSSFVGQKGLPSPADTPYETPGFIRSKRSSRATVHSSREQSASPPPLPPESTEIAERSREGKYSALDPRRFTPTLHASLVSEILNLRRELDSKNSLVENLETSLASTKTENETLTERVSHHVKEAKKAKVQVEQMEKGTYDAVQDLVRERDAARQAADDMQAKLDLASRKARTQDEDAVRTQDIWDNEKESWEKERRQLERRVHITESRLRTIVDEMTAQQAASGTQEVQYGDIPDEHTLKDSGLGNDSDTASIASMTPVKHRRNTSSVSHRTRSLRNSISTRASAATPELHGRPSGYNLADELDIDEEDEYDLDDFEHADEAFDYPEPKRRTVIHSRDGSFSAELDAKAKRVLGLTEEPQSPSKASTQSPTRTRSHNASLDSTAPAELSRSSGRPMPSPPVLKPQQIPKTNQVEYKDNGCQPSPPPSPPKTRSQGTLTDAVEVPEIKVAEPKIPANPTTQPSGHDVAAKHALSVATRITASMSPISPPETPIVDEAAWGGNRQDSASAVSYASTATQTDWDSKERPSSIRSSKRDSLQPPMFVPSIAIHPPNSRPASPRSYVLPPGTKNASTQAHVPWPGCDAAVQTEPIRIDKRLRRAPSRLHLAKSAELTTSPGLVQRPHSSLLPSPSLPERLPPPPPTLRRTSPPVNHAADQSDEAIPVSHSTVSSPRSHSTQSNFSSPEDVPTRGPKAKRHLPLKALPLPKPTLAPAHQDHDSRDEVINEGPLNRSSHYGITRPQQNAPQLLDIDQDSETSEYDDQLTEVDFDDLTGSIPAFSRAPQGRFGLSEPPKAVPEDKEISPDRRPATAESFGAAPPPSISSSRATSQRVSQRPTAKHTSRKDFRSRSPSFGSVASTYSSASAAPPFPIPTRSSSRIIPTAHSEGSESPTPHYGNEIFGRGGHRSSRARHVQHNSLRKVQSAAVMRQGPGRTRTSPQKPRRRRKSPDLTPVQSMAFDNPAPTKFPIPELPTPMRDHQSFDLVKGSVDLTARPSTSGTAEGGSVAEETSLVDAIAATMVGEWMWKYIRKRKSFGITESGGDPASDHMNTHGTRHKRWVWLSPYERTIMWDTKQPTSGTALLGKKGRKLTIQSVFDVEDNTPLPKNPEFGSAVNRSILIVTNVRALKFTATTRERHNLWMTALSFLAESGHQPQQLSPSVPAHGPPPPTPLESVPIKRRRSPPFGRTNIRDSVRLAKGRRPSMHASVTGPAHTSVPGGDTDAKDFGADFPAVPRLYSGTAKHQRKRSNTSPRLPAPLNNVRSFSSSAVASSTSASSRPTPASVNGSSLRTDLLSSSSKSGSRRESVASPDRPNFFEAVGTLRMEAFVDPNVRDGVLYVPAPPPVPAAHAQSPRRRRGDSNFSQTTNEKRRAGYVFDENGVDPFQGF
ncbi:hypothetical protein D0863_06907 [Hortaea werneckii]|uniref:Pleckstrin homology domain-containing protein n=1 Tax=Hortaea werneckii TaxID=91943 RepID=A0A3M7DWR5_HORWE|nr:hypothetical protein D0863_06907 [Hortaea werneckii]